MQVYKRIIISESNKLACFEPGKTTDGKNTYLYGLGLSVEDLNKIVLTDPVRTFNKFFMSALTPILKSPIEFGANKDFFFDTNIDSYDKAYRVLAPIKEIPALADYLGFKEYTGKDGKIRYRINPYAAKMLRDSPLGRFYTTFGKMTDSDRTWGNILLEQIGGKTIVVNPEAEKRRQLKQAIQAYLKQQRIGGAPVREFTRPYVPKDLKHLATPELLEAIKAYGEKVTELGQ